MKEKLSTSRGNANGSRYLRHRVNSAAEEETRGISWRRLIRYGRGNTRSDNLRSLSIFGTRRGHRPGLEEVLQCFSRCYRLHLFLRDCGSRVLSPIRGDLNGQFEGDHGRGDRCPGWVVRYGEIESVDAGDKAGVESWYEGLVLGEIKRNENFGSVEALSIVCG